MEENGLWGDIKYKCPLSLQPTGGAGLCLIDSSWLVLHCRDQSPQVMCRLFVISNGIEE